VDDREILETYSNSASKNTSETDIFPHGPKSFLTSVIKQFNVHYDLIKWRKCVEFKYTSAQPETSAVNFETLFGEIKYKTYH